MAAVAERQARETALRANLEQGALSYDLHGLRAVVEAQALMQE